MNVATKLLIQGLKEQVAELTAKVKHLEGQAAKVSPKAKSATKGKGEGGK